jgi:hypothetical protein
VLDLVWQYDKFFAETLVKLTFMIQVYSLLRKADV